MRFLDGLSDRKNEYFLLCYCYMYNFYSFKYVNFLVNDQESGSYINMFTHTFC